MASQGLVCGRHGTLLVLAWHGCNPSMLVSWLGRGGQAMVALLLQMVMVVPVRPKNCTLTYIGGGEESKKTPPRVGV